MSVRFALLICLTLLPGLAGAECLTARSAAAGIGFTRVNAGPGTLVTVDGKTFRIDYAAGQRHRAETAQGLLGLYEAETVVWKGDPDVVGGPGSTRILRRFSGKPPMPEAGKTWKTKVRATIEFDTNTATGTVTTTDNYQAVYTYQAPRDVTLSGCSYRAMAVEARLTGKETDALFRWTWFPDLGFALRTRFIDFRYGINEETGLTALRALR